MNSFRKINEAHWSVQPIWMKRLIVVFALPAWLVAGYGIVTGQLDERVIDAAAVIMMVAAVVSTSFIAAAYWRKEI